MYSIIFLAAFSSPALAKGVAAVAPHQLFARQDQSFVPPTTIESSCASNEVQCPGEFNGLPYCVTPSRGDVCCSEGYGCPGGNFCLTNGLCCPDGIDPKTCALEQGVTLPNNFQTGKTVAFSDSTPATSSSPPPLPPASTPTTKAQAPTTEATNVQTPTTEAAPVTHPSSATVPVLTTTNKPYTISGSSTTANSTATGIGAGPTGITPFTGAASALPLAGSTILAAFGGIVACLLW